METTKLGPLTVSRLCLGAMLMGGNFSIMDYMIWNELPTVLGNLVGGLAFTGLTLYATHVRTAPKRRLHQAGLQPAE